MKYTIEEHERLLDTMQTLESSPEDLAVFYADLLAEVKRDFKEIVKLNCELADIETRLADAVETLKYYANATWDDGGFEGEHAKIILCAGNEAGYKRAKDCLSRITADTPDRKGGVTPNYIIHSPSWGMLGTYSTIERATEALNRGMRKPRNHEWDLSNDGKIVSDARILRRNGEKWEPVEPEK